MLHSVISSANSIVAPTAPLVSTRSRTKTVLIASADASLRARLRECLSGLRWQVLEAPGGAEAWLAAKTAMPQLDAMVIDPWLADLEVNEFLSEFHRENPLVDVMMTDGTPFQEGTRSPHRQELLYALRSLESDTASWQAAPELEERSDSIAQLFLARGQQRPQAFDSGLRNPVCMSASESPSRQSSNDKSTDLTRLAQSPQQGAGIPVSLAGGGVPAMIVARREAQTEPIPELIGSSAVMLDVSRRIRLVAARSTPVLIEGPTGTGKELVAEALHRLSTRSRKPFVAINCAAIPEALLEAELFGHTRGAFTGAVQGRIGRIESADGGTLFLDEIGEIPLALQSKLLRFFESGELQRIGDNERVKVDVRIVAATHQPMAELAQKGLFRADLYYRLAVFLIRTPALSEHMEDLPQLVGHFLERMGRKSPVKRIDPGAMSKLSGHPWPGNVRELEHVLERAAILAGDEPVISRDEIDFGLVPVN
ncbi:sigma-54-dependent transcriptional regulator [Acidicapsa acidisoli]|uniref:sigma-54-dependent transcriptional regulator n=1 Tax=Acidicapsa acidisoli TaxID=1615681 RepID=UPI0021DFDC6E|nr:sigma-54 dependent transcriptional regulator [Acidicapsa acidisoli]